MANHTPGPWVWTEYSINGDGKNKRTVLCGVGYFPHVLISDENKSLIAAAPDLLAACDGLLDVLDWLGANLPEETIIPLMAGVVIEDKKIAAIKAVKKANGEA